MALTAGIVEQIAAWCATSSEIGNIRSKARSEFFGYDVPGEVHYMKGVDDITSRERRFLGWFALTFKMPDGRSPAELAAAAILSGSELASTIDSLKGARHVLAMVAMVNPGRGLILRLEDEEFTVERFSKLLADNNRMLKSVLVGRDALVVGLSNSAFQDIIYRARLHPKRKASELEANERRGLYDAIRFVLKERIRLKGKNQFKDLYGNQGDYTPAMGPNMKQKTCPECGTPIEKLSHGGGHVYLCPQCQA